MKILMLLSYPEMTGPAELALEDAVGLRSRGHEIVFGCDTKRGLSKEERRRIVSGEKTLEGDLSGHVFKDYASLIEREGFQVMDELRLCKSCPLPHEIISDVLRLRRRMKSAQLVHTRFAHDFLVASIAAKLMKHPPAIVHSLEQVQKRRPGKALRDADALIFPCEFSRQAFLKKSRGKIDPEKTFVLPGRVDAKAFCPSDPNGGAVSEGSNDLRGELGFQKDDLVFGIVSRIKVDRRHDLLIRAFARVLNSLPQAKLCIFGRGEHIPKLKALIESLGVGKSVIWGGYRMGDELTKAYRTLSAKVWLVQGNDGTSRAVLESMACGTPVIAGDGGAQAELVRHGVDGFVVPLKTGWKPGDSDSEAEIEALADAMVKLGDDGVRKTMAGGVRERALEFVPEKRAVRLEEIYLKALSRSEVADDSLITY